MRHMRNRFKLGMDTDRRVALVRNQAAALFMHGYLNTTATRAKAVQRFAERLITKAKRGDLSSIRDVAKYLPGLPPLRALLRTVVPAVKDIDSGYTQIAKLKYRRGDGALVVRLSVRNYPQEVEAAS
jgi:large subunit ribosomal protein L17